jgi:acyl-CoA synthetase (AMP-forming)/AMP-acid ligase II
MPPGSPGEILLKGPIIFRGYHNRPEETAKSLKDGWYYTGDIGEMRGDLLYIVDRKKVWASSACTVCCIHQNYHFLRCYVMTCVRHGYQMKRSRLVDVILLEFAVT